MTKTKVTKYSITDLTSEEFNVIRVALFIAKNELTNEFDIIADELRARIIELLNEKE